MLATSTQPVARVIQQHAEESAILRNARSVLLNAPHIKLGHLRRFDDRIVAHLDGLKVAGESGSVQCLAALETPGVGEVFTAAVRAIEDKEAKRLDEIIALAEATQEAQRGFASAFGWVSSQHLQGTVSELLSSPSRFRRLVGIAACAMHRVDAGAMLGAAITDPDAALRTRALRTIGELGRRDSLASVRNALDDKDDLCRFWAARSAVLLGDRGEAVNAMKTYALCTGPLRLRALGIVLKALEVKDAHSLLKALSKEQEVTNLRIVIRGGGIAGDPKYVPWLISHMEGPKTARIAGEAFMFITGADLAYLSLDHKAPEDYESGPTDDPDDDNVSMDPDDDLPWPDAEKIQTWWEGNRAKFPEGVRHFVGAPPTWEHCVHVLKEGYQRQRIAAAEWLCLLKPGTQLFPTSAPAWRQQRWLGQLA
jgi:uncharacterized protein (TIGR02270 family)